MGNSIKNLVNDFISNLAEKGRSPATTMAYRSDLDQLTEFLTKNNIVTAENIKDQDLNNFKDALIKQKFTLKTVSRKLNAIKSFFRWLIENNYIKTDVSKSVTHPKIESAMPKFLTPLEYRALRDAVRNDVRIHAMIELILQTGLRISEVATLKLRNILDESIKIDSYSTQPERNIPLNSPAKESLDRYLKERPKIESEYCFISKSGKPLAVRNIRASIDRFMQKAELPKYSVNDLRTTFIVENLKNGVDLILISQIIGHKRISTTEKYLDLAKIKDSGKKQALIEL